MRQLYLYVEGKTEQTFADEVLKPHLAQHEVFLMGAVLAEVSRSKGRKYRGGVLRYVPFRRGLNALLKQHDRPGVTLSTMIDLYALPTDFPGWEDSERMKSNPPGRCSKLEQSLAAEINPDPTRFIPYIQLHEYEALLFVNPKELGLFFSEQTSALAELQRIADNYPNPELIDDGKQTAPSERILKHLPAYDKVVVGPQVARAIGLDALRARCPHFNEWVSRLEQLGQSPVSSRE